MSNPGGGAVEYDIIQLLATRTRDAFVFGSDCFFMALSSIFDDWFAFYLRKFIIERNIGTGGLEI